MICSDPFLERWFPDFSSSGIVSPEWNRARFNQYELCNSLEWALWNRNPVQVQRCNACGSEGCASGGYVHLSRFSNFVVWTAPQIDSATADVEMQVSGATIIEKFGSIGFPYSSWQTLEIAASRVPEIAEIEVANGRVISDAWFAGPGKPSGIERLLSDLGDRLLGCDSLGIKEAIAEVQFWVDWFQARRFEPINGTLLEIDNPDADIETLYFDGPVEEDWPALGLYAGRFHPVIGKNGVFIPGDQ